MNQLNPRALVIMIFLITGLIWSHGHVGWLIALGIYTAYAAFA